MRSVRDLHKDVIGGGLMIIVGCAVAVHSTSFTIGSLSTMGSGYFPLALGVLLAFVGVAIAVNGYRATLEGITKDKDKERQSPEWKARALICLGIVSFVILARYLGLAVATFSIVFISAIGGRQNSWRTAALLATSMVIVAVVVFWWGLQLQMPLFKWGFV